LKIALPNIWFECAKPALLAASLLAFSANAQAPLDIRIALVIGNAAYAGSAALANPANDARAMTDTLKQLGFSVVEIRDGSKAQITDAIATVRDALKGRQGVGMLYYAGHGLQLDWRNYMVPVDAKLFKAADVAEQTVDLNSVIEAFKLAGNRMNIVVLDACRDNPFGGSTASGKGLAQLDAPLGTFLAYATAPGNVAEDGDVKSGNGLYTQFLLEELKKPTAKIEDVFKRVRFNVRRQSQGRQIPWESTSLEDDFYFNKGVKVEIAKPNEIARETAFTFEKAEWDRIKDSKSAVDLYAFLNKFPNGNISELAQARLEAIDKARIVAQPGRDGKVQGSAANRFRDGDRFEFIAKDGLTGIETGRPSVVIIKRGEDEFEGRAVGMGSALVNSAGFVSKDGSGSFDPPWATSPGGDLQVGKKWSARSIHTANNGSRGWVDIEAKVTALEKVTVPLGTFDAYRLEVNFVFQSGERRKMTFWYDPEWSAYSLKLVSEFRNRNGSPNISVREMTSRKRAS